MSETICTLLDDRGVISISGKDARSFLQGIITCDVEKVSPTNAVFGAFLTPQGKFLFDFFMTEFNGNLLLDTERDRIPDFIKRLSMYKLRADITLEDVSEDYQVSALFGDSNISDLGTKPGTTKSLGDGIIFTDPRLSEAGVRAILPNDDNSLESYARVSQETYEQHRISLGLPNSSKDLIVDKSTLLENGFDELNGVDWDKGCYMGQEVTARTKHRGLIKKRLVCVEIEGPPPALGTPLMDGEREAGEMRSSSGNLGLALIKLDFLDKQLHADQATLTPRIPNWANS